MTAPVTEWDRAADATFFSCHSRATATNESIGGGPTSARSSVIRRIAARARFLACRARIDAGTVAEPVSRFACPDRLDGAFDEMSWCGRQEFRSGDAADLPAPADVPAM
jgi:hypothetical protein